MLICCGVIAMPAEYTSRIDDHHNDSPIAFFLPMSMSSVSSVTLSTSRWEAVQSQTGVLQAVVLTLEFEQGFEQVCRATHQSDVDLSCCQDAQKRSAISRRKLALSAIYLCLAQKLHGLKTNPLH